jgi:glycosyltransferase involved in cell wall biosynthesis
MQQLVESMARDTHCDVVIASQIDTAPYVRSLEGVVSVLEELELSVIRDKWLSQQSLLRRVRFHLTWWKLTSYLPRMLDDFAGCTVVSEQERRLIEAVAPGFGPVAIVPNGVDLDAYAGDFGSEQPGTMVYTGALTYGANYDAMEYFMHSVLPLVQARYPDVKLRITGGLQGVDLDRLPIGDGVELTGYLEDIRSVIAQSALCIVPLRIGGGTRLKILEAMALGTPVVSTTKGAEGLHVTHGKDILIADGPEAFAEAVLRLLNDADLRSSLSDRAKAMVSERYSWRRCVAALEAMLNELHWAKRARADA